jgi:hypothetical protein
MLRLKSGLRPLSADIHEVERTDENCREAKRGPQDLTAALTVSAIEYQHLE